MKGLFSLGKRLASLIFLLCSCLYTRSTIIIIRVLCPKAGPSLQVEKPGLQFCRRQVFHCKLRNQSCSFTRDLRCSNFPLLSAPRSPFSIWTNLKRSEKIPGVRMRRWGEWIWLTGPSGLHRNSPQGLNISSIRVFDQIRDPEIPFNLRPLIHHIGPYLIFCVSAFLLRYFETVPCSGRRYLLTLQDGSGAKSRALW